MGLNDSYHQFDESKTPQPERLLISEIRNPSDRLLKAHSMKTH